MGLDTFKNHLAKAAYGITKDEAHTKRICISCKKEPTFYSHAGLREYRISGMCEPCFDNLFKEKE